MHGIAAHAEIGEHARASEDSAQQPAAAAFPTPAVTRAQAVQEAIIHATDLKEGSKAADLDETSADESDSDGDDGLLAQLSQSMFAALRPQAETESAPAEAAKRRASSESTAEADRLTASQPQTLQTSRDSLTAGTSVTPVIAASVAAASAAFLMLLHLSITADTAAT